MKALSSTAVQMELIGRLTPLTRTTVSDGFDQALSIINEYVPLNIISIPSGTECWTWPIPQKWTMRKATVSLNGQVVLEGGEHALAVAPYSQPFSGEVERAELVQHLRWSEKWPDAFVYEYRYAYNYQMRDWCMSMPHNRVKALPEGRYKVEIDATLSPGEMKIGEILLQGESDECIVIVSHLCHPGQANDGVAGAAGVARLYHDLAQRKSRKFSYLFLFPPETIGMVGYLWARQDMIPRLRAGIDLEMLGVDNPLCLKLSHQGDAAIDRIAQSALSEEIKDSKVRVGAFREMYGNDEIVLADPDFNVPTIAIQHHPFPEYHTSHDDLASVKPERMDEAHRAIMSIIDVLEADYVPHREFTGPLYLSRYNLYVDTHQDRVLHRQVWNIMQRLGTGKSVFQIAEELSLDFWKLKNYLAAWLENGLLSPRPSNILKGK